MTPSGSPAPSVSVVTVVKNGERFLSQAIASILRQTLAPVEIIVVDGESTDNTAGIARSYSQVRYLRQQGQGLAGARNAGIDAARGELIAFLDHDDLWHEKKLEVQVGRMQRDPALGYTTTLMEFLVEAGAGRMAAEAPRHGCTPSALVARRELFAILGGFDPEYAIGCDADWFTRARDAGIPTAVIPQVLLYKRLHDGNLSTDAARNRREMFLIARRSIARRRRE